MSRFNIDTLQGEEDYRRSVSNWAAESREVVGAEAIAAMTAAEVEEAVEAYWQDELRQAQTAREEGEYVSDWGELEDVFKSTFRHEFLFLTSSDDGSNPTGWVGEQEREQLHAKFTAAGEHWAAQMHERGEEVTAAYLVDAVREQAASTIANFVYTSDDEIRAYILETIIKEVAAKVVATYSVGQPSSVGEG